MKLCIPFCGQDSRGVYFGKNFIKFYFCNVAWLFLGRRGFFDLKDDFHVRKRQKQGNSNGIDGDYREDG